MFYLVQCCKNGNCNQLVFNHTIVGNSRQYLHQTFFDVTTNFFSGSEIVLTKISQRRFGSERYNSFRRGIPRHSLRLSQRSRQLTVVTELILHVAQTTRSLFYFKVSTRRKQFPGKNQDANVKACHAD